MSSLPNWSQRRWRPYKKAHFMDLIEVDQRTGCWMWTGAFIAGGAPVYKGWEYAYKLVYLHVFGPNALAGKRINGKTCGRKGCVNPFHQKLQNGRRRDY